MPDIQDLNASDREAILSNNLEAVSEEGKQIAYSFLGIEPQQDELLEPREPDQPSEEDPELSAGERFAYGMASTKSDLQLAYRAAQVNLGLGEFSYEGGGLMYRPQSLAYGEEFANASPEMKAAVLENVDRIKLEQQFPEASQQEGMGGFAGFGGSVAGALLTPSTLLGGGLAKLGWKGLATLGAGFGAEYNALEQLAKTATIDPKELATVTGVSAIATPMTAKAFSLLGSGVKRGLAAKSQPKKLQAANEQMAEVQRIILEERMRAPAKGGAQSLDKIWPKIQGRLGINRETLDELQATSTIKLVMPKTRTEAQEQLATLNGEIDSVTSGGFLGLKNLLASASTEIAKISPRIGGAVRMYDAKLQVKTAQYMKRIEPFLKEAEKIPAKAMQQAHRLFLSNDIQGAKAVLAPHSKTIGATIDESALVLRDLLAEMKKVGYKVTNNQGYWPRRLISYKELLAQTDRKDVPKLERMMLARAKQLKTTVAELPQDEVDDVAALFFTKRDKSGLSTTSNATKKRQMDIDESLAGLYFQADISLAQHVRSTVQKIARAEFLGKKAMSTKGKQNVDFSKSLTRMLAEETQFKSLNSQDASRLHELLDARFGLAEKASSAFMNKTKNAMYMATIANPMSALTQMQDVGLSVFANGLIPTIKALVGTKQFKLEKFDLDGRISAEMATVGGMAKALDRMFQITGFKLADRIGKETLMNASYNKFSKMAKTPEGVEKLRKRFGHVFGDEFDLLVSDLKAGRVTDNVDYMVSAELMNWQPTAISELPLFYQQHPELRVGYTLKSFTIKQLDVIRREIVDEFKAGNTAHATRMLFGYTASLGLAGAGVQEIKDFLSRDNPIRAEDIPDQFAVALWKQVGLSRYLVENKFMEGRPLAALGELAFPPLNLFDNLIQDFFKLSTGQIKPSEAQSLPNVPVVGRLTKDWLLGARKEKKIKDMINRDY